MRIFIFKISFTPINVYIIVGELHSKCAL
jgi:hypothetical protein